MLKSELSQLVAQAADQDINGLYVEYPRDASHGDYASPLALKLAKEAGKNPRDVAAELLAKLETNGLAELEIAGPGFINFRLTDSALLQELENFLKSPQQYRLPAPKTDKPIICEYSDPNVAKPLGVHHLLGTVIGQAIANLHRYLGYEVISINHIGDWGSQFGKLLYAIKEWGDKDVISKEPIAELLKLYVRFHNESEEDVDLLDKGRAEFKKLEDKDPENTELWEWVVTESMRDVQQTYDALGGVAFDHVMGESFYSEMMDDIVDKGLETDVFAIGEGGAVIAEFPEEYPTTIIKRSDGATVYITRDLATLRYRCQEWEPAKILYVVDVAQKLHFQQIFSIVERMNLYDPSKTEPEHVIYGRMSFKDGKMSTRKGNIILLDQLLTEADDRALQIVEDKSKGLDEEAQKTVAHMIGSGSVKYAILSQNRTTNMVFDWDKAISLQGNSAAYLQYTYARAASILREAGVPKARDFADASLLAEEKEILRLIPKFPEAIVQSTHDYRPHYLSEYLFTCAQSFNSFYTNVPVLKSEGQERELRLGICEAVANILKIGLDLLAGIEVPERM